MNNTFNLQKYKRAKLIVKDIENILPVLKTSYSSLKPYMKYRAIMEVLDVLHDAELILETHLRNEKRIVSNQGME